MGGLIWFVGHGGKGELIFKAGFADGIYTLISAIFPLAQVFDT